MSNKTEKPILGAQKQHWEGMLRSKPEMFGREPSAPASAASAAFRRAGAKTILELGGGQGNQGFIVHFFDRAKVDLLASGWEIVGVEEFAEGKLPRRLYRVTMRKPSAG